MDDAEKLIQLQKLVSDNERDINRRIGEETLDLVERSILHISTLAPIDDASMALAAALISAEGN